MKPPDRLDIVFDFGNVLLAWEPERLIRAHFQQLDRWPDGVETLARALTEHPDWHGFDDGSVTAEELADRSAERLRIDRGDMLRLLAAIPHDLPPMAESIAALEQLFEQATPGRGLFFLSNMPAPYAQVLERQHDWIARFHDGIFSARIGLAKPDPAIYHAAEERFDLDPATTLFLDDNARNVEAARRRGWMAELINASQSVPAALRKHGLLS